MWRSVPMVHLRIQAPVGDASRVARSIAREGLLHLVDIAHGRFDRDASPPGIHELLAAYRDLARRARRLGERLGVALAEPSGSLGSETGDLAREREWLDARLAPLERRIDALTSEAAGARAAASRARDALRNAARLGDAGLDLGRLSRLAFASVRIGEAAPEELASLATLLSPAPFAIVPLVSAAGKELAAVAVPLGHDAALQAALRAVSFEAIGLPATWDRDRAGTDAREAEESAAAKEAEVAAGRDGWVAELAEITRRADLGVLLLQAESCFAAAGRFVVISGWVPEEAALRMRAVVREGTEGRALVEVERPEDLPEVAAGTLKVPILARNPILLRPFQRLVALYGTPSYDEVEPTAFFALSFLLMFGLMFGDVGHGLVLFSAGWCLYRWLPHYLDYAVLLMEVGASSTLFGFLYGSFFGVAGLLPVLWMEPLHDLSSFLLVALGLGVVLVTLGLLLNVRNAWRAGEKGAALFGPRGLLGAFLYWVLLGLAVRAFLPASAFLPSWALFALLGAAVAALALRGPVVRRLERDRPARRGVGATPAGLAVLESAVELVDTLVSFFANTVSFLRVAAFAMVHAGAFLAVFALADTLRALRLGGALSVLALVAGNAVVILLEGLTVSVQALRLEYYEFFGKFFRGGGEPYRPLMLVPDGKTRGET